MSYRLLMQRYKYLKYKGKVILKMKKEIIEYLKKTENPYRLKVGNMTVELKYSDNKRIDECILNILKQKIGK